MVQLRRGTLLRGLFKFLQKARKHGLFHSESQGVGIRHAQADLVARISTGGEQ